MYCNRQMMIDNIKKLQMKIFMLNKIDLFEEFFKGHWSKITSFKIQGNFCTEVFSNLPLFIIALTICVGY